MRDNFLPALSLEGRRALITGAGSSIGQMIALGYAQAGADLVLVGRRAAPLEATAVAARKFGAVVEVIPADITVELDVERIKEAAGHIDILVNNAGSAKFLLPQWKNEVGAESSISLLFTVDWVEIYPFIQELNGMSPHTLQANMQCME